LVSHGKLQLNGKRVTIPSIRLRVGDSFGPTEAGKKIDLVRATLEEPALERAEWIAFDAQTQIAHLSHLPGGDAVPFPLDLQRVVEYYATRM
jgi:small subunit ribosomal protein S4